MRHYNEYFTYEYLTYINNNARTCKIKIINDYKRIGSFSLYCHHFAKKKTIPIARRYRELHLWSYVDNLNGNDNWLIATNIQIS